MISFALKEVGIVICIWKNQLRNYKGGLCGRAMTTNKNYSVTPTGYPI